MPPGLSAIQAASGGQGFAMSIPCCASSIQRWCERRLTHKASKLAATATPLSPSPR